MRALFGAVVLALATSLSGCFCVTNIAYIGLSVGEPSKIDSQQPQVAISDIVGLAGVSTPGGYLLHVNALLEDGRVVHLVASAPASAIGDPNVVTFDPVSAPLPRGEFPIVVPDWSWTTLDDKRHSDPNLSIGVGSAIHRTLTDGSLEPELTRLTAGLAATCGIVTLHLVRDPGLRRQTWQIGFSPPHAAGRIALLTQDSSLYGPLPPAGTVGKTIVFCIFSPFLVTIDLVLWGSCIGMAVEFPLGYHYGWMQADTSP